jgi:hypothetical protein
MPSGAFRRFTDPDDYAAAIRATRAELPVLGRGSFAGKLTRIDLHHLCMQRFSDNLPRIAHSAAMTGRAIISSRTEPGPDLRWGGIDVQPASIMRHSEGQNSFQRSAGSACWGAMSLPVEEMASVGTAVAGCDLTSPADMLIVTPPPAAMAKLQRLHAAAGQLASSPFLRDHDAEFLADTGWDEHLQGYFGLVLNGRRRCNAAGSDLGLCCGSGRAGIRSRPRGRRRNRLQQCS